MRNRSIIIVTIILGLALVLVLAQTYLDKTTNSKKPSGQIKEISYQEETEVVEGLAVNLGDFSESPQVGLVSPLRFLVVKKPESLPINELGDESNPIEVMGIRDDLKEFFRVYPSKVAPGLWAASYTFTRPGNYKFFSKVRSGETIRSFGHPMITVDGRLEKVERKIDYGKQKSIGEYDVRISYGRLVKGEEVNLNFEIKNGSTNVNFTPALTILKDDLSKYVYSRNLSGTTSFAVRFPEAGVYVAVLQLKAESSDSYTTTQFYLRVE